MRAYDVAVVSFGSFGTAVSTVRAACAQVPAPECVVVVENSQDPASWACWRAYAEESGAGSVRSRAARDDGVRERVEVSPDAGPRIVLVWSETNAGFSEGNNLALRHCGSPLLLTLNPDCVPRTDAALRLSQALVGDVAVASGYLARSNEPGADATLDYAGASVSFLTGRTTINRSSPAPEQRSPRGRFGLEIYAGACAMFDRDRLASIDFFPRDQFLYYDEFVVSVRLRRAGHRTALVPVVVGTHARHSTTRGLSGKSTLEAYHAARSAMVAGYEAGRWTGHAWLLARAAHSLVQAAASPRRGAAGFRGILAGLSQA